MPDVPSGKEPIPRERLHEILEQHKKWLESEGKEGQKADLERANLTDADLRGVNLARADLDRANLAGANLERANLAGAGLFYAVLSGARLWKADLSGADLRGATLTDAKLQYATLPGAKLIVAILTGADLFHATLTGALLSLADLTGADLKYADLTRADLTHTTLSGADLYRANLTGVVLGETRLDNADLRRVRGLKLDDTFIRGAQFTPVVSRWRAILLGADNDQWSVLRQFYSGPRTLFLFFFVVLFALPYVGRAVFYGTTSAAEQRVIDAWDRQKDRWREPHRAIAGPAAEAIRTPFEGAEDWFRRHARPRPIWQVLLKWDEGKVWPTVLAVALIAYNVGLYWLITGVGPLRDEEERSGWSPAWMDYGYLRWVHRVVSALFYLSLGSFVWNVWQLLNEVVWVPAAGG